MAPAVTASSDRRPRLAKPPAFQAAHRFGWPGRLHGMTEQRHVRIEYRVREDIDLDRLAASIGEFVAGMRAHDGSHDYTSYRDAKDPRHFVHVGHFEATAAATLQTQPFFQAFTAHLKEACASGPDVTQLVPVASTR
jgi:quinol monooxygenase YgiN